MSLQEVLTICIENGDNYQQYMNALDKAQTSILKQTFNHGSSLCNVSVPQTFDVFPKYCDNIADTAVYLNLLLATDFVKHWTGYEWIQLIESFGKSLNICPFQLQLYSSTESLLDSFDKENKFDFEISLLISCEKYWNDSNFEETIQQLIDDSKKFKFDEIYIIDWKFYTKTTENILRRNRRQLTIDGEVVDGDVNEDIVMMSEYISMPSNEIIPTPVEENTNVLYYTSVILSSTVLVSFETETSLLILSTEYVSPTSIKVFESSIETEAYSNTVTEDMMTLFIPTTSLTTEFVTSSSDVLSSSSLFRQPSLKLESTLFLSSAVSGIISPSIMIEQSSPLSVNSFTVSSGLVPDVTETKEFETSVLEILSETVTQFSTMIAFSEVLSFSQFETSVDITESIAETSVNVFSPITSVIQPSHTMNLLFSSSGVVSFTSNVEIIATTIAISSSLIALSSVMTDLVIPTSSLSEISSHDQQESTSRFFFSSSLFSIDTDNTTFVILSSTPEATVSDDTSMFSDLLFLSSSDLQLSTFISQIAPTSVLTEENMLTSTSDTTNNNLFSSRYFETSSTMNLISTKVSMKTSTSLSSLITLSVSPSLSLTPSPPPQTDELFFSSSNYIVDTEIDLSTPLDLLTPSLSSSLITPSLSHSLSPIPSISPTPSISAIPPPLPPPPPPPSIIESLVSYSSAVSLSSIYSFQTETAETILFSTSSFDLLITPTSVLLSDMFSATDAPVSSFDMTESSLFVQSTPIAPSIMVSSSEFHLTNTNMLSDISASSETFGFVFSTTISTQLTESNVLSISENETSIVSTLLETEMLFTSSMPTLSSTIIVSEVISPISSFSFDEFNESFLTGMKSTLPMSSFVPLTHTLSSTLNSEFNSPSPSFDEFITASFLLDKSSFVKSQDLSTFFIETDSIMLDSRIAFSTSRSSLLFASTVNPISESTIPKSTFFDLSSLIFDSTTRYQTPILSLSSFFVSHSISDIGISDATSLKVEPSSLSAISEEVTYFSTLQIEQTDSTEITSLFMQISSSSFPPTPTIILSDSYSDSIFSARISDTSLFFSSEDSYSSSSLSISVSIQSSVNLITNVIQPTPNIGLILLNPLGILLVDQGQPFRFEIPEMTFVSEGATEIVVEIYNDTDDLFLTSASWLQITTGNVIEGLVLSNEIKKNAITDHRFTLVATDTTGFTASDSLVIRIIPQSTIENFVTIGIDGKFNLFANNLSAKLELVNKLNEPSLENEVFIDNFSNGSIIVSFSNLTIDRSSCPKFLEWFKTIYTNNNYTTTFRKKLDPFVLLGTAKISGRCSEQEIQSVIESIVPSVLFISDQLTENFIILVTVFPCFIFICLLLLLGIFLCCTYRRTRPERKELESKKLFLNCSPIILPGELEATPYRSTNPIILPHEQPVRRGYSHLVNQEEAELDMVTEEEFEEELVNISVYDIEIDPPPPYILPPIIFNSVKHDFHI